MTWMCNPEDVLKLFADIKPNNIYDIHNFMNIMLFDEEADANIDSYKSVPISMLRPSESLAEKDRIKIDELKDIIHNKTLELPPILVWFTNALPRNNIKFFEILDGHHRYIAHKELNYDFVPVAVLTLPFMYRNPRSVSIDVLQTIIKNNTQCTSNH